MLKEFYAKPASALLIMAFIGLAGVYEFINLPIALYPQTNKPEVTAWIKTSGTNADEFFKRFGEDMESAFVGIKGVENVIGRYRNGQTKFEVFFHWGFDPDEAESSIRNTVGRFTSQFPDHWGNPYIRFSGSHGSQIYASLRNDSGRDLNLYEIADKAIIPKLRTIPGVEGAWVRKPTRKGISINLLPDQLLQHGFTYLDIRHRLKEHEYDRTLGTIRIPGTDSVQVSAHREPDSLEEIRSLIIGERNNRPVRLREVAEVKISYTPEERIFTTDAKRLTMISGSVQQDANIREVSTAFIKSLEQAAQAIDPQLKVDILLNPAAFINAAVFHVIMAVVIGMLIATLVVFVFLRTISSTIVVCISIPLSLIGGFVLMDALNLEINLISLGAMALAVGMVVDGAVVVLENIVRYFERDQPKTPQQRLHVIYNAVKEVRRPIFASLLTTIIVFAPLPFTSPIAAAILGDLAVVMVSVLIFSIAVTLIFIPPLVVFVSSNGQRMRHSSPRWLLRIQNLYTGLLAKLIKSKIRSAMFLSAMAAMIAIGVLVLMWFIPRSIIGEAQSSLVLWQIDIQDEQMTLTERAKIVSNYELQVRQRYGNKISKTISETRLNSRSTIWIFIRNRNDFEDVRHDINAHFRDTPLVQFRASNWSPTKLELPSPPDVKVVVTAQSGQERRQYLAKIDDIGDDSGIFYRVRTRPSERKDKFIKVNLNVEKLSLTDRRKANLPDYSAVYDSIASTMRDEELYRITIKSEDLPVNLTFPETFTKTLRNLGNLLINYGDRIVPLRALAEVVHTKEWSEFYTENGKPLAYAEAWVDPQSGLDRQAAEAKFRQLLAQSHLDPSKYHFVDTMTEINDNLRSLTVALLLALMLIMVIITVQFGYLHHTLLIMLAIPLGFVGVAFSLFTFSSELSVNSMLGLILLCGTAVNNSIIFVDFFNQRWQPGMNLQQALMETAKLRFRPIMLTTMTTILGMLPIAFGFGSSGEILQPLGIAVCGGLWISTLLTLFAVPTGITLLTSRQDSST